MSSETQQQRYWCHSCRAQVSIYMAPDPTCTRCDEQFIEEMADEDSNDLQHFLDTGREDNEERENHRAGLQDLFAGFLNSFSSGGNGAQPMQTEQGSNPLGAFLQNFASQLQNDGQGPQQQEGDETSDRTRNPSEPGSEGASQPRHRHHTVYMGSADENGRVAFHVMNPNSEQSNAMEEPVGAGGDPGNHIDSLMQLIQALGGGLGGPMVGNPDDYVFSQDALDNIITQLMEQTGGTTAPPPAPEEVIEGLPKRMLKKEELDRQADCAVCKEEFSTEDKEVRELPCQHIFHDDCIKPWLKTNGTCPVCRHSVLPDAKDSTKESQEGASSQSSETLTGLAGSQTTSPMPQPTSTPIATAPTQSIPALSLLNNSTRGLSSFSWPNMIFGAGQRANTQNTTTTRTHPSESSTDSNTNQRSESRDSSNNNNTSSTDNECQQGRQRPPPSNEHDTPDMDLDLD